MLGSLLGYEVSAIAVSLDHTLLRIRTGLNSLNIDEDSLINPYEDHYFATLGDCCNQVWWNDIIGVETLLNQVILGVRITPKSCIGQGSEGVLEEYKVTLETSLGRTDLIFRNDHNGYYGGSCKLLTEEDLKKECWKRKQEFIEIERDWSADD